MHELGKSLTQERLRRLLFLVPYISRHPGEKVSVLAQAMGVSAQALLEDLDLLTLVGRPPFQPDDYIDIYVEDDRVYVELDQRLSAPPRLTASEGVALAAAAALLRPAAQDALASALAKLEAVLPPKAKERFLGMARQLDLTVDAPFGLAALSQAIVAREEIALDYYSAGRGSTERRTVRPYELFSHRGQWYLQAFCLTRQDVRLFRLDRIAALERTGVPFAPPSDNVAHALPRPTQAHGPVRVRFSTAVAPYVRERFGADATLLGGGELEVTVPGDNPRWLTGWVLSFGGEAVVLEPDWAREAVAQAAAASVGS